jgi:hypothetical protein
VNGTLETLHEFMMFDNHYGKHESSRMLIVALNERTRTLTETWEYRTGQSSRCRPAAPLSTTPRAHATRVTPHAMCVAPHSNLPLLNRPYLAVSWSSCPGAYTPVYGDNDRLPSGNLLGCFWVSDFNVSQWAEQGDADEQFEVRAIEVVRKTQLPAWRASVQGRVCETGVCADNNVGTWKMYSVERFYTAPLVHNVACEKGVLSFDTQNNFKQNNADPGTYEIVGDVAGLVASGSFAFEPHWIPASVSVDIPPKLINVTLFVTNKWGDVKYQNVTCS